MKHTLVLVGYTGVRTAYLDITVDEAKDRYERDNGETIDYKYISVFEFTDEFGCYDAWSR